MQISTVLSPLSSENLRLAAQCGVEGYVARYPGPNFEDLLGVKQQVEEAGLKLVALEGFLPIEKIKLGTDHDGKELDAVKQLIVHMGRAGVPVLCYNFMAGTDWVRTKLDVLERGGALVTEFNLEDAERAVKLDHSGGGDFHDVNSVQGIDVHTLWKNLEEFLKEVVPVAEKARVSLAMHPDDPPLEELFGNARIMNCVENFERLVNLVPSPSNGVCYCQANFVAMEADIPDAIQRLGEHIKYVHFRDVRGTAKSFVETFHDNGPTDMAESIRLLKAIGFRGPIRPDHVPQLEGEEDGDHGYTMLGRLFAFGYIRGLMHGTEGDERRRARDEGVSEKVKNTSRGMS